MILDVNLNFEMAILQKIVTTNTIISITSLSDQQKTVVLTI